MTSTEIFQALNEFRGLYPNYYKDNSRTAMEQVAKSWMRRFSKVDDYKTFVDAMYEFERTSDYANPPTTKQLLDLYRTMKSRSKSKSGGRRIVTDDEWKYELYLKEMKKEPGKRDEWLIKRLLPSCEIMTNPEAYKRKYGTSREEHERL